MIDSGAVRAVRGGRDLGRLVYTSWFGDLGGGELRLLDHLRATAFDRRDAAVIVNQPGRLLEEVAALGIATRLVPWKGGAGHAMRQFHWYRAWLTTWALLLRLAPRLVVCNTFFDFETTGRLAAMQRRRLVWRARADTFPEAIHWPPVRRERLVRLLNRRVDRILATTAYEAAMMVDCGVHADKVHVVPNGVDLARYGRAAAGERLRSDLGMRDDALTIAFVARMVPQKGYEVFFDALARLKARGVKVQALVAGDTTLLEESPDRYRSELRDRAARLGISAEVVFLGFRDDVNAVMQAADVFVLASLREPFGTTVIEAMAAGRPVVASDLPGPRESIVEGRTGLFFPPGDADALADRLALLARDAPMRAALGAAGRCRVEAEFDLARNVRRLDEHCADVALLRRPVAETAA